MSIDRSDPLTTLLSLVRAAARDGAAEALAAREEPPQEALGALLDKRALAYALGVSTATVDRLCREGRIPFVRVGDVRRFDLQAVRAALEATRREGAQPRPLRNAQRRDPSEPGVRLLTRKASL